MDKWIKKLWNIYAMEYYSAIKNEEFLAFATTQMDFEGIMLSEINQTEKKIWYDLTCMWNLKEKNTHQTPRQRDSVCVTRGRGSSRKLEKGR